jgi:hypothetical protein
MAQVTVLIRRHIVPVAVAMVWLLGIAVEPAFAQVDLFGSWINLNHKDGVERGTGPYAVDYTGIPLNEEGRTRALTYSIGQQSMVERQCRKWPPIFLLTGPFDLKIWNHVDPATSVTTAWVVETIRDRAQFTIWVDGRTHPTSSLAPTSSEGFATGRMEGNALVAEFTHMTPNELRRNGVPFSDRAKLTLRFLPHDDLLTVLGVFEDPVFLSEPYVLSSTFRRGPARSTEITHYTCVPAYEGSSGLQHFLPGENPSVDELTKIYGIPRQAILGGAETMYPEFRDRIKDEYARPEWCTRYCAPRSQTGDGGGSGPAVVRRPQPQQKR